jgi:MFS family permease
MSNSRRYAGNITKFYLYTAFKSLYLWMPILIIYLQHRQHLSLTQITLLSSVSWLVAAFAEIPTGVVADAFGRKASVLLGNLLEIVAIVMYALAPSFEILLVADVLWGISISFFSGATDAFLYDSLKVVDREGDYTRVSGRLEALTQAAMAIGALAGGLIGAYDLRLPLLITAALNLVTFAIALTMKEPPVNQQSPSAPRPSYRETLRQTAGLLRAQPALRYLLIYGALLPVAAFITSMTLLQPHAVGLGLPIALMGVLLIGIRGSTMGGSVIAGLSAERVGERAVLLIAPLLIIGSLLLLAVTRSAWNLLLFGAISLVTAVVRPLIGAIIQRYLPGEVRATVLSVRALLFTFVLAGMEPTVGMLGDRYGLSASFVALAVATAFALATLLVMGERHATRPELAESPSA